MIVLDPYSSRLFNSIIMARYFDYENLLTGIQLDAAGNQKVPAWVQQTIGNRDFCPRCRLVFQSDLGDNTRWMLDGGTDRRNRIVLPASVPILQKTCTLCCFIWDSLDAASQKSIRNIEGSRSQGDSPLDMTIEFRLNGENIDVITWVLSVRDERSIVILHFRVQNCMCYTD
jgi:hypothetical protein